MIFEPIIETVLNHPLQVVLLGVVLFHALCEVLAAIPLRTEKTVRRARLLDAA